ncbi:UCH-domain-containing protein [Exidia glandulosa HHB12029]|uniref:ubiquitinyl hydrolase 1 n=1 Tax=Exidia glandulosa HHB12029 TaxID=1314781 RepID=A0A165JBK9_EXIGL|nr:UCH-domain-containing protein [Exidia glandulosa HHB12029]
MQGAIAEAFGSLLQRLYDTGSSSMAPREFKTALQRFAPQFIGYQQHDSQELLAFLLDGLHEDLNRILKKPYVENPDWEGGGEKELIKLARTTWDGYLSVIVDLSAVHSSLKIDLVVRIPARANELSANVGYENAVFDAGSLGLRRTMSAFSEIWRGTRK